MINKVWKRQKNEVSKNIETISFDTKGDLIIKRKFYDGTNAKSTSNRPLIVFHYGEYTFYLNMRSAKKDRKKLPFEYELSNPKRKQNDWVDTTNIMVMDTEEFDLLYKDREFEEINNLNYEDARNIVDLLIDNFTDNKFNYDITYQRIEINKKTMQPESKIIISTFKFDEEKYMEGIDIDHFLDHLGFIFEDLENASKEDFQEYIKHNKNDWDLICKKYRKNNKIKKKDKEFEMQM
ncbi:Mbov_0400 family ICE element protein [Mycoplasmopsis columboralis]|uniref:Uncharacterized protein n=1 Tax=Mycoplasmopsis columboralis TaxID=171282 RepID=A0A449B6N9_9BACT|nr:hypothetical protein [Mycoplasmopsis columboralis]VEU76249.1 Uncharacterised protein [Mycoplasmopsis columboralis]